MARTSTLPSIRVEPALRRAAERVLRPGETLSSFIEAAVRETVERRENDAFIARGFASLAKGRRTRRYFTTDEVLRGIEKRLAAAKR